MEGNRKRNGFISCVIKGFVVALCCLCGALNMGVTYGASASVTISTKSAEVKVGDTLSIVITAESSAMISDVEAYISYDPLIIEFISGGSKVTGGNGLLFISDIENKVSTLKKYTLKFKAIKSGSSELAIADKPMVYGGGEREEMSVSKNSLTVHINEQQEKNNSSNLKTLSFIDADIAPKFSPSIKEYTVTVGNKVSNIAVRATAENVDAKIEITGNDNLVEGDNEVKITVNVGGQNKTQYNIVVHRKTKQEEAYEKEEKEVADKQEGDTGIDGFYVYKNDGSIVFENSYQYILLDVPENAKIPTGYQKTSIILSDITIPVYEAKTKKADKDFFVLYAKNEDGEEGFYQYDRKEKTLQRYQGSLSEVTKEEIVEEDAMEENYYKEQVNQMMIIIFILIGISVVFLLIIVKLILTGRAKHPMDE